MLISKVSQSKSVHATLEDEPPQTSPPSQVDTDHIQVPAVAISNSTRMFVFRLNK